MYPRPRSHCELTTKRVVAIKHQPHGVSPLQRIMGTDSSSSSSGIRTHEMKDLRPDRTSFYYVV